jgi:thioredoxin-dependent peroxiredoxin
MLKVGDKAPDFTLQSDEGKDVSLEDFKGKRVILFFFPKANTPG